MKRKISVLALAVFLVFSSSVLSFAQQNSDLAPVVPAGSEAAATAKPVATEWLYGEVNSVDIAAKSMILTYLDYDTDIEKQATVYTDAKTIFENVKALEEVKPQDMVSIDYVIGADSKSLAVSISVEKPESMDDLDMGGIPPEHKQQIKPAVEDAAVPAAEDSSAEPKGQ
jgi:hypothetical protein